MARFYDYNSVFLLVFSGVVILVSANYDLRITNQDFNIKVDDKANFALRLNPIANETFDIKLSCDDKWSAFDSIQVHCNVLKGIDSLYVIPYDQNELNVTVVGAKPGRVTLIAHVNQSFVESKNAFTRINIGRSSVIDIISAIFGWLYFIAWSISFYPQIIDNYRAKSVKGLNFDYVGLNITGFLCYSFFNVSLYFLPLIQSQYEDKFPRSQIPVEINDVVFALHAVFATIVIITQCIIYEKNADQRMSLFAKGFLVIAWSSSAILAIVVPLTNSMTWLSYLYFFSYIKLTITFIKYIPQAYYNYKRQSTKGWSIGNILLDFTGGVLSLLQMFMLAYNYDDWITIFTNFTKFGLGMFSILFDVLFMIQHYILYRHALDYDQSAQLTVNDIDRIIS